MKWKKLGKIFDPTEYNDGIVRDWMKEYAQCPSAVVYNDFVRIYFSSRPERDANGQATSYTGFFDVDIDDLHNIIRVSAKPVLPLGELGTFDENAVYPTCVLKQNDQYLLYYAGWSRCQSVPFNTSIGVAVSKDGVAFQRLGPGPILSASLYEPFVISGPKVRIYGDTWYMFYLAGTKWISTDGKPEIVYKIRMATSNNGLDWVKVNRNIIDDLVEENECQAGPDVFYYNGKYHMYFVYRYALDFRGNNGRGYKIGYAISEDLINWQRDDVNAGIAYSETGWDSQMHHYPHYFTVKGKAYLLHNGNEFGRYGIGLAVLEDE